MLTWYRDASVLARLTEVETRLQALEGQAATQASHPSQSTPGWQGGQEAEVVESISNGLVAGMPDLHTASGLKMLVCWPRLRLRYNPLGVSATTYLKEAEDTDTASRLASATDSAGRSMDGWDILQTIESFYMSNVDHLPLPMLSCFASCAGLSREHIIADLGLAAAQSSPVDFQQLVPSVLLVLSIALRSRHNQPSSPGFDIADGFALSDAAFSTFLQKSWTILSSSEEETLAVQLLGACFMTFYWARPYHALGLLQSIRPVLEIHHIKNPRSG